MNIYFSNHSDIGWNPSSVDTGTIKIVLLRVCIWLIVHDIIIKVKSIFLGLFGLAIKQYHKKRYFLLFL
ncbi:hypothetical protein MAMMFC1_02118 [Methylomusa anaerophila]|uniref:Uncharacterized protein n=1 Tax=Methylomusa anaerophila TaxID=1930071 RepID=A0A348AK36_9FIRM|nr:hypothetical protein MAMMFC1_02118 [Methylomusa anaerophila]